MFTHVLLAQFAIAYAKQQLDEKMKCLSSVPEGNPIEEMEIQADIKDIKKVILMADGLEYQNPRYDKNGVGHIDLVIPAEPCCGGVIDFDDEDQENSK
ncbi:MAG: hypothetical protein IJF90_05360 [Synergistaceae bacterium]|nr:hypothetical protein [Synergistaceae bacterium]